MAKVAFSKLSKVKNLPSKTVSFDGNDIEFEQYLPLEEKINLIQAVIELAGDEVGFFNIVKLEAFYRVMMIKKYTNISFTEKQMEDIPKLYDLITLNGVWDFVEENIPQKEREYVWSNILELAERITSFNHSALGIIKSIQTSSALNEEGLSQLINELQNNENFQMVKELLPHLV